MSKTVEMIGLISGCIILPSIVLAGWYCSRQMDKVFDHWEEQANKELNQEEADND